MNYSLGQKVAPSGPVFCTHVTHRGSVYERGDRVGKRARWAASANGSIVPMLTPWPNPRVRVTKHWPQSPCNPGILVELHLLKVELPSGAS